MLLTKRLGALLCGIFLCLGVLSVMASTNFTPTAYEKTVLKSAPNLDPTVLNDALLAYQAARKQGISITNPYLTVIDYSLPSTAKRLWVIDIQHRRCLMNLLVTHATKTGELYAHSFSNRLNSHKSSLGLYLTRNSYDGNEGYSLVLDGLEPGFNSNAKRRLIVMHSAWYATEHAANQYGELGLSWGCPVVDPLYVHALIDTIKEGSLVFVYYPNSYWLEHSRFLSSARAV